ncbi:MAG: hypothetical protein M3168_05400 [Actinomycetota bacterium]|nr:hypothetical protein [Actinomycetota bacterium]
MPTPRVPGRDSRARRKKAAADRRLRRYAGLAVVGSVVLVTLVLTAFGSAPAGSSTSATAVPPGLTPAGPPAPQVVAEYRDLRLHLPIAQQHLSAIGYHGAGVGALPLEPLGRQGNRGALGRLLDRVFGTDGGGLIWYQLEGGRGPSTSALAVGAAPGTDVYSPVDGTVVGIFDFVLNQRRYGVRVDIQPTTAPSLVVSVARLRPDPALTVGTTVVAARNRLGTVLDLAEVERQALARYTQDAGNHVTVEVRPAATLALP